MDKRRDWIVNYWGIFSHFKGKAIQFVHQHVLYQAVVKLFFALHECCIIF